ncbi:MAG TPA: hypothetical protein VLU98_03825 [Methanomicrobiales archaeon]|nr:hypothetical protein [Methanomicrobiales archaeon]
MVVSKISMGSIAVCCIVVVVMALRCGDTTLLETWFTALRAARHRD